MPSHVDGQRLFVPAMRSARDIFYNFHWVVPGEAARAAQAILGGLTGLLKQHGIAGIVNLRGHNPDYGWWNYETRICRNLGIVHRDAMLDSRKLPTRAMLASLFDAFDGVPKPFLLKCSGGQDRTALASALFLVHRDGWRAREASEKQFARFPYLHFPKKHQRWLRPFLDFAQSDAAGMPVAQWARERYTPRTLEAWLNANGFDGTFKEVFTKPEASRWQW